MCGAWLSGSLHATPSPDNAIECVVHGCDVLNKKGFAHPYVLSEHTLVIISLITPCQAADRCVCKQSVAPDPLTPQKVGKHIFLG